LAQLSKEDATVLAAMVAALAALVSALAAIVSARNRESRDSHRALLVQLVSQLGTAIHGTVASCQVFVIRVRNGGALDIWLERARKSSGRLKKQIPRVKYPLWGIEDGLRVIARLPDLLSHHRKNPDKAEALFEQGERVRLLIDSVIFECYTRGRSPSSAERKSVRVAVACFDKQWKSGNGERE
jgi:hypothetical protein